MFVVTVASFLLPSLVQAQHVVLPHCLSGSIATTQRSMSAAAIRWDPHLFFSLLPRGTLSLRDSHTPSGRPSQHRTVRSQ